MQILTTRHGIAVHDSACQAHKELEDKVFAERPKLKGSLDSARYDDLVEADILYIPSACVKHQFKWFGPLVVHNAAFAAFRKDIMRCEGIYTTYIAKEDGSGKFVLRVRFIT